MRNDWGTNVGIFIIAFVTAVLVVDLVESASAVIGAPTTFAGAFVFLFGLGGFLCVVYVSNVLVCSTR